MTASLFDEELFDGHLEPWRVALASVLCWLITSASVAAGIGGGGLLVPMYAIVLGLGPKLAVPVSKATIFGVAIGNVALITRRRHPRAARPLIDYSIAVLMQSGVLLGVVLGVLLNLVLPEIVIVIVLALVLGFNAYKTLGKGFQRWAAETRVRGQQLADLPRASDVTPAVKEEPTKEEPGAREDASAHAESMSKPRKELLLRKGLPQEVVSCEPLEIETGAGQLHCDDGKAAPSPALAQALRDDGVQYPLWAWGSLFFMCAFLVLYSLALNGGLAVVVPTRRHGRARAHTQAAPEAHWRLASRGDNDRCSPARNAADAPAALRRHTIPGRRRLPRRLLADPRAAGPVLRQLARALRVAQPP